VPNSRLKPQSGLEAFAHGARPASAQATGVRIELRTDLALATVLVRIGQCESLAQRVRESFDLELPTSPRRSGTGAIAFAWAGPGHWLASSAGETPQAFELRLRSRLSPSAAICGQSDGRTVFRVAGPNARAALAKGISIDLHPSAFEPGDAAVTAVGQIGVHLWQIDSAPTYEIAVFRSFAPAFWQWLNQALSEFGVEVVVR
jgi:heterotetrameric sarcosine oxidase gamma subunit